MTCTIGKDVGFSKIRRVTGYLTGDVKNMNNSKQQEVVQRVKHVVAQPPVDKDTTLRPHYG